MSDLTPAAGSAGTSAEPGTLRIWLPAAPRHLNPLVAPDRATLWVAEDTIFEALLRYDRSGGRYQPGLATSWRVLAGGREIRLALRDGVTFHDGRKLAPLDVQFSLDAARGRAGRSERFDRLLSNVTSVLIAGPGEVKVLLREPDAYALRALAEVPILPAHIYGKGTLARSPANREPVGTGPYRFVSWTDEAIVLERAPEYWGQAPDTARLSFVVEPDASQALVRARRGEIDVIPELIPSHYPRQVRVASTQDHFEALRLRPPWLHYVVLNTRRTPFDDPRVRRAYLHFIDRKRLARTLHRGLARPVTGLIWPGGPGDGKAPPEIPFDPEAGKRLLDEAGWVVDAKSGLRARGSERLRVQVLVSTDDDTRAERELLLDALRAAGFQVVLRPGDPAVLKNRLRAGDFDVGFVEWRGHVDDDVCEMLSSRGSRNFGGYASEPVDAVCAALRTAWEPGDRLVKMEHLGELAAGDAPLLPLWAPDPYGLVRKRVTGVRVFDGWILLREVRLREETP